MDNKGTIISNPKNKKDLHVMVDGGFTANFPIRLFDSTKYIDPSKQNEFFYNQQTLGLRIDSEEQIKNDTTEKGMAPLPVRNFRQYITAFYTIVLENLNRQTLTKEDWGRTVSISDGSIGPKIKGLSSIEKERLLNNGRLSMTTYLVMRKR
jgi:NTE family protein